jgi:SRSO17 transposase
MYATLTNGVRSSIVDFRLYLPAEWAEDTERCNAAKIPAAEQRFRKKSELACEMIDRAIAARMRFGWILADGGYGKEPDFLRKLDDRHLRFIVDVHKTQRIYSDDPKIYLPRRKQGKGRKYTRYRARGCDETVDAFFSAMPKSQWSNHTLRDTTRGPLKVEACSRRVWLWDGEEETAREWTVVCAKFKDTGDTKYFLSNAPANTPLKVLLRKHAERFWIERTFQDAKGAVGMADYQVRSWVAWHHHMSMVALALLFMLRERVVHNSDIKLLSCNDIVELLTVYLPRNDADPDAVILNIERRHRKRQAAINSAQRRPPGAGTSATVGI